MTKFWWLGEESRLHEALKAQSLLENDGVCIRVVDLFSIKHLDKEGILREALECKGLILVVEDHYENGGIKGEYKWLFNFYFNIILFYLILFF